ncbi:MAG: InlB B-repeat-containing protein [Treponema sp.]|nr:InlB B-repeat-containing protein [Treponema sp.]
MKKLILTLCIILIFAACGGTSNTSTNKYTVIYYGNGQTSGYPPVDNNQYTSGSYATVLDKNTLEKTGYKFTCWNTKQDRSGTDYASGDKIEIKNINIFLYAVWSKE